MATFPSTLALPVQTAKQRSLDGFPNEILYEIAGNLSTGHLVTLCLVSKLFQLVSTEKLYQDIRLERSTSKTMAFFRTLLSNPYAAHAVRVLVLAWYVGLISRNSDIF
jgi:hypothetical protein